MFAEKIAKIRTTKISCHTVFVFEAKCECEWNSAKKKSTLTFVVFSNVKLSTMASILIGWFDP